MNSKSRVACPLAMSPTWLSATIVALGLLCGLAQGAGAEAAKPLAQKVVSKAKKSKAPKVLLTGSRIKRPFTQPADLQTASISPLVVIDQDAIRRSGASSVTGVLIRYGLR